VSEYRRFFLSETFGDILQIISSFLSFCETESLVRFNISINGWLGVLGTEIILVEWK